MPPLLKAEAIPVPAGEGHDGVLEAAEVDASTVRTAQMLKQVSKMTRKDSGGVATLVESWIDLER